MGINTFVFAFLLSVTAISFAAPSSRLSDEPITPIYDGYERNPPLLELGQPFLDTGNIDPGFELPTGAVWQPQFLVFGDYRTAIQDYDNAGTHVTEWSNRLNLFGQLRLSGTERLLIGIRPLDREGLFTGQQFEPNKEWNDEFNANIRTLYFEGDFGEIFPNLDETDSQKLDWGFSVGRMPILTQEGLLIDDTLDGIGIVRNSITLSDIANLRITGFYSWNQIHRDNNINDESAKLYALFTEWDTFYSTVTADFIYVDSEKITAGDGYYAGISSVQRIGHWNTSFRAAYSHAADNENAFVSTGTLLFAETSYSPKGTYDNLYINGFLGIDQFSSAARDPSSGGPLGRTGILFSSVSLGAYGSALSNRPDDAYGASIGYQKFLSGHRKQLIVELGGREETKGKDTGAIAVGARYQQAFGKHTILVVDGFISEWESTEGGSGIRTELRWKF